MAEANEAYERWVAEETVWEKADEDIWMGEEVTQEAGEQGMSVTMPAVTEKMLHVKVVSQPGLKDEPKIIIPPGSILHKVPCMRCMVKNVACTGPVRWMCDGCACIKQGCKKLNKSMGKKVQKGTSTTQSLKAAKASLSKRAADDDNDEVQVVKSCACVKGKATVCGGLDSKVTANLSQSLRLLHTEATELHAAYLCLQVCVDQLTEALEKIGVDSSRADCS
ncbi:hypothetical protein M404DRAFT_28914 [Pisolithus tinctorius Marx 270]|uniref:Uncharacterized protein n=1 Tax=Pisolithus tinctorius Marx 270 TaxID=870435 RepID=A0A0C3P1G6_PISTI|nr:hypothetical protein M404DRAFT_28914 [Pisolithus tinctorius Marx 270]